MKTCQPIVYTRPREVSTLDYCYFVKPKVLEGEVALQREVDRHVRNVLAEDGYRGAIKGRRWHVFRFSDFVLVGMATREFARKDALERPIRGYYGVVMRASDAAIPSKDVLREMDACFVAPQFETRDRIVPEYSDRVPVPVATQTDVPADESTETVGAIRMEEHAFSFNEDVGMVRCFPPMTEDDVPMVLAAALDRARRVASFEMVSGFNNLEHACSMGVMNAFVDGVETVADHSAKEQASRDSQDGRGKPVELSEPKVARKIHLSVDVKKDISEDELSHIICQIERAVRSRLWGAGSALRKGEISNLAIEVVKPTTGATKAAVLSPSRVEPDWSIGFGHKRNMMC